MIQVISSATHIVNSHYYSHLNNRGRKYEDLSPRFAIHQTFGFFLGPSVSVYSPTVRSVAELAKLRTFMDPVRECARGNQGGRGSMIWRYSQVELEDMWHRFQRAVAEMWEMTGKCSAPQIKRMHAMYKSSAGIRQKHLQYWERQHMAMHDRKKHRPAHLRCRRRRRAPNVDKLTRVRRLLRGWGKAMKKQEHMAEKARQKQLRQRKRERLERQRSEKLKKKRVREEQKSERLRREALRRRMKDPKLTMDDLMGHLDAPMLDTPMILNITVSIPFVEVTAVVVSG